MRHSDFKTDRARWRAVTERDPNADGHFLFAVTTTGVYCRPQCRSRLPNRENVRFFTRQNAAKAAGFRACKRCQPDAQSPAKKRSQTIARVCRLIDAAEPTPTLAQVASAVHMSPFHLHRLFKTETGLTPRVYAAARRAQRLRAALQDGLKVSDAVFAAGFGASSRAYERAQRELGMRPRQFRDGGRGVKIRYAIATTVLGKMLLAATDKGVCAIEFGASNATLIASLGRRFAAAEIKHSSRELGPWLRRAARYAAAPSGMLDLPLDIRGTAFQERVWQALRRIPAGQTVSYTQVAQKIGQPAAVRAVAGACANNSVAMAIPCHRVVRRNGDLADYRWGRERKRALIDSELKYNATPNAPPKLP
jgi:AraC family transcriptional regulator of adaptative response/methylated-DNA-[protein]-cysteine methyltransferase